MNVFDLYAKISIDTSEYEKGLKSASTESKSLAANIGSGLQAQQRPELVRSKK